MSLGVRATSKGGGKTNHQPQVKYNHVAHTKTTEKAQVKIQQPTAEQLRLAQMIEPGGTEVGEDIKKKVQELMETTCRTEEEVCSALYDCNNDADAACNMLIDHTEPIQGQWQTNEKKKKKPAVIAAGGGQSGPPGGDAADSDWGNRRHRPRRSGRSGAGGEGGDEESGGGGPSSDRERERGGRGRAAGRGGRFGGGRGGGRGGRGGRRPTYNRDRGGRGMYSGGGGGGGGGGSGMENNPVDDWNTPTSNNDDWDTSTTVNTNSFPQTDDWDNSEEWSGSLADTKVFEASGPQMQPQPTDDQQTAQQDASDWSSQLDPVVENQYSSEMTINQNQYSNSSQVYSNQDQLNTSNPNQYSSSQPPTSPYSSDLNSSQSQYASQTVYSSHDQHSSSGNISGSSQPMGITGTLSPEQTQYLSTFTRQAEANAASLPNPPQQHYQSSVYSVNYGVYGSSDISNQRKPQQRARVPPPSKIPSSAVEMPSAPGDNSIAFLDVQFGALDFENSFTDNSVNSQSDSSSSQTTQILSSHDTDYNTSHNMLTDVLNSVEKPSSSPSANSRTQVSQLDSSQTSVEQSSQITPSIVEATSIPSAPTTPLSTVSNAMTTHSSAAAPATSPAIVAVPSATPAAAQYPHYQDQHHHYQNQQNVYQVAPGIYHQMNSTGTSLIGGTGLAASYPTGASLAQYQQVNTYQNGLQTSAAASVYGTALYTSGGGQTPAGTTYAYQQPQQNSQTKKEAQYEGAVTSSNSLSNATVTQSSSSKISNSSGKASQLVSSSSSSPPSSQQTHVQYAPPTHLTTHTPLPHHQQHAQHTTFYQSAAGAGSAGTGAATYATYDDLQMLRSSAVPHHMATGYFEVGYGGLGGVGGVGAATRDTAPFSIATADHRFARTDASSPQSQQAAGVGAATGVGGATAQALINPSTGLPPGYTYAFYGSGIMPPTGYQYGTPPMYQYGSNATTGAAGVAGGAGKTTAAGAYSAVYAAAAGAGQPQPPPSAQPALAQPPPAQTQQSQQQQYDTQQEQYKQGYSTGQAAKVSPADLNSMYGKQLNKVNSYDKGFHSSLGVGGAPHQLYVAAPPPIHHHHQHHHMDARVNNNHRRDNGANSGSRGAGGQNKQSKGGYAASYWASN